jgi:hypothetical protein
MPCDVRCNGRSYVVQSSLVKKEEERNEDATIRRTANKPASAAMSRQPKKTAKFNRVM